MAHNFTIIFLAGILVFTSCKAEKENQIPYGAIPVIYKEHIYIKGEADGINGNYVFDTGAVNLYYDSTHYADNKFNYENTYLADLIGVGITPKTIDVIEDSIRFKFGENLYETSNVPIISLKPIVGDLVDGVLGMEYFYDSILEINYEMEYMKIYKSIDSLNLQGWSKIGLTKKDNSLYIPLEILINDTVNIAGTYQLDFGSGGTVGLTSLVSGQYNLSEQIKNKVLYFTKHGGAGGASSGYYFSANTVKIGDFKFDNVLMDFSSDTLGAMASEEYLGILGNGIYERFNVYIDFINNDLYLKPNKNYDKPFEVPKLGFSYVDRIQTLNSWIVTGLYTSSNAEKSGLKIDDKIISVNGLNVREITYKHQQTFFDDIDKINLGVERNGSFMEIYFTLQPIIKTANNR